MSQLTELSIPAQYRVQTCGLWLYYGLGLMQMSHDRYAGLVTVDKCTMWPKGWQYKVK